MARRSMMPTWARSSTTSLPTIEIRPNPTARLQQLASARCPGHFNKIVTGGAFAAFCRAK
jgi:hypothetical protein